MLRKQFIVILVTLVIGITIGRYLKPVDVVNSAQAKKVVPMRKQQFPVDSVIMYMKQLNIKYLEFSFAQFEHESATFSSPIFEDNYNMAGMKVAYKRPTPAIGENRGHAQYRNWRDSVIDFAIFQAWALAKTNNKEEYMEYIQKYYSTDKDYLKKVNKHVKENRECLIFTD